MWSTKRSLTIVSALLLSLSAPLALAAGAAAVTVDPTACEKPEFPVRWQVEGDMGSVVIAYLVDADGKVLASKLVESSGSARVDRASVRAGARCKFQPAIGQTTASWAKVKYTWVVE